MRQLPLAVLLFLLIVSAQPQRTIAADGRPQTALSAGGTPALVVVLVVDQMRRDYIEDYGGAWKGGLRRLLDEGAWFTNAAYPYLTTLTCPGHATIATGSLPATHGIISNQWWDRGSQQLISCTDDPSSKEVPFGGNRPPGSGGSGRLLAVPTLASVLAGAKPTAGQVVALSLKRASSAMLSGIKGNSVIWRQGDGWSTSTTYSSEPDRATMKFLTANPIEHDFGAAWNREGKKSEYKYDDNGLGEKPSVEWTAEFPHLLQPRSGKPTTYFYEAWEESPYADTYMGRLAAALVDGLKLGKGQATDYLAVSFSTLDIVGHDFGPRSHEIQDVLRRLDETLGDLIAQLDKKVGRDRYVLALSADHGVATGRDQGGHVEGSANRRAAAPDEAFALERAAIAGQGRHADESRDLFAGERAEFGQIAEQRAADDGTDAGDGAQQILFDPPDGTGLDGPIQVVIHLVELTLEPADMLHDAPTDRGHGVLESIAFGAHHAEDLSAPRQQLSLIHI